MMCALIGGKGRGFLIARNRLPFLPEFLEWWEASKPPPRGIRSDSHPLCARKKMFEPAFRLWVQGPRGATICLWLVHGLDLCSERRLQTNCRRPAFSSTKVPYWTNHSKYASPCFIRRKGSSAEGDFETDAVQAKVWVLKAGDVQATPSGTPGACKARNLNAVGLLWRSSDGQDENIIWVCIFKKRTSPWKKEYIGSLVIYADLAPPPPKNCATVLAAGQNKLGVFSIQGQRQTMMFVSVFNCPTWLPYYVSAQPKLAN